MYSKGRFRLLPARLKGGVYEERLVRCLPGVKVGGLDILPVC